ncbi:MAG: short-chain dehydrogenase [Candidatus Poribacteria bacterium]|nr:MAG: short-chain dehydrogenase [Candidatus Poribacteria bacterium]
MVTQRFRNQVVLVAGGTGGLGKAVVRAFLEEGAQVAALARSQEKLNALAAELESFADRLDCRSVDLTQEEPTRSAVQAVHRRFGRIDGLVNAVGGYFGGVPIAEMTLEQWDSMQRINVRTVLNTVRATLPYLQAGGGGFIVNVGSRAGLGGIAGMGAYCAAKAAVKVITEALAAEMLDAGIRVNCVLPSIIDTPENRRAMPKADFSRWVQPEEIARTILFLASGEASAISGASIPVYGRA